MNSYKIHPISPQAHIFQIDLCVSQPTPKGQLLTLPAWIPGSYMIRDFAKNIVTLNANCGGNPVKVVKTDKLSWLCDSCDGELKIRYQVYAWDLSVRSAHLDTTHGYFNGTSVFLKVVGHECEACNVDILPPDGKAYAHWRVATTLTRLNETAHLGFGRYRAGNYDELIDHPVEMGDFTFASFEVSGVSHEIAITGRHGADMGRLCNDLKPICELHVQMFGGLPEMDRYLFQVMAIGDGYGGLEHRSSTSLICKRDDLPYQGMDKPSEGYRQFLGLCSHEYFHLWNVKRIRPKVFMDADLSIEVHTKLLWVFEGFTSYFDDLSLVRSQRIEPESYLELLAQVITRVMRGTGRQKQTITESSFDTWTKFYKQDENAPNAIVSYYTKGALVALALDLTIRLRTESTKSLDSVMRALWDRFGSRGVGLGEEDIEPLISEVTGLTLERFFSQALYSTEDLPMDSLLASVGVGYDMRPSKGLHDKGGIRKGNSNSEVPKRTLGVRFRANDLGIELTHVLDQGAAQDAGLSAGDVILAVDGIRVKFANIDKLVERIPSGQSIEVHAFRRDELMRFQLTPKPSPVDTCDLWLMDNADSGQLERRRYWLNLK